MSKLKHYKVVVKSFCQEKNYNAEEFYLMGYNAM
jgi:hypothetical protein